MRLARRREGRFFLTATTTLFCVFASISTAKSDFLDQVLAAAVFEESSPLCQGGGSVTRFSTTYVSTADVSHWNSVIRPYEPNVFEIDMIHHNHSDASGRSNWKLRLGKGGQISSLITPAGEAIANQANPKAAWNDLVQQMVAVNGALNTPDQKNFIHQAGPYMNDTGMPPPFYSPKVALHYEGNDLATVNWGQQAHVPTQFDSPLLYYTRYRDCGQGVIEHDMAIHHMGQVPEDIYTFVNTPWTSVRTSTYGDVMIANETGQLEPHYPLLSFGADGPQLRNLDTTGGFTTFAENLPKGDFDFGFCVDTTQDSSRDPDAVANAPCNASNPDLVEFSFTVQRNNSASQTDLWETYGYTSTVKVDLCNLTAPVKIGSVGWGNSFYGVLLVNNRTGYEFQSRYVIHYCWQGKETHLETTVPHTELNQEFIEGDRVTVKYFPGPSTNNQNGLTIVHGKNPEYPDVYYRAPSRLRFGSTNALRDGTVWTTNWLGYLRPTQTYFSRKYMIIDKLSNMESVASEFVEETFEDVKISDIDGSELPPGETIKLWSRQDGFGATIGEDRICFDSSLVCVGSSTPRTISARPLFYMTCGSENATSHNPYHFAVITGDSENMYRKPYLCTGEGLSTRAEWKLLGFFDSGTCASIGSLPYSSTFCPESNSPSMTPSKSASPSQSVAPSTSPSVSMAPSTSTIPSSSPSQTTEPSTAPSRLPSFSPSTAPSKSVVPSSRPSLSTVPSDRPSSSSSPSGSPSTVSERPSILPSEALTSFPSEFPSDFPTAGPSVSPSGVPSKSRSAEPSNTPSTEPSILSTETPSSSFSPSGLLSGISSIEPSVSPSGVSSKSPSSVPSNTPSTEPSFLPTKALSPSSSPTDKAILSSESPSEIPSDISNLGPSLRPSLLVSPSDAPSSRSSAVQSNGPSVTVEPSKGPTSELPTCENGKITCSSGEVCDSDINTCRVPLCTDNVFGNCPRPGIDGMSETECNTKNGQCFNPNHCGNGVCEVELDENCNNCPDDCLVIRDKCCGGGSEGDGCTWRCSRRGVTCDDGQWGAVAIKIFGDCRTRSGDKKRRVYRSQELWSRCLEG